MATANTEIKIATYETIKKYDTKIKEKIAADDAQVLKSAKEYAENLTVELQNGIDSLANGTVKTNTDAITKLNGDETVDGSVAKQIKDASTTLKEEISASAYDDTDIKKRITANEDALTNLIGTGEGSVDKKVADAVAAIVSDAPEAYDTLKEISDWISTHTSDASAMNTQINANKADIVELKKLVTQLPEGTEATTIVEYISEKVSGMKTELTTDIATAKSEAITTANTNTDTKIASKVGDIGESTVKAYVDAAKIEATNSASTDAKAKADKALEDAKVYTDTLAERVGALESTTYVEITDEEIDSLFATVVE